MARRIGEHGKPSAYAQQERFAHLFVVASKNSASRDFIAETIKGIIEKGTAELPYPTGPDALPFLGWRGSMTDEQRLLSMAPTMTRGMQESSATSEWQHAQRVSRPSRHMGR